MKKLTEGAREDYRAEQRRKRLTPHMTPSESIWRYGTASPPKPSDDELEEIAKRRMREGRHAIRDTYADEDLEDDKINRTEKRRLDKHGSKPPLSMPIDDREESIEDYRTDIASFGSLSTKEPFDYRKRSIAGVIKDDVQSLLGDVSSLCDFGGVQGPRFGDEECSAILKGLLYGDPDDAIAVVGDIADAANGLKKYLEQNISDLSHRYNIRNAFNKATAKRKLPESVESPFNGMSVSQMRFLNEGMMDDSRYSVSFRGGALDPHPISIEVDADCEQTALEMAVAKLEKEYEGRCLIDPQEVENGGDDYNEDNALYIDATTEGASQPWYVDPQMVHIEELPPRGYDSDGYDSMDDNALPEDF